MLGGTQSLHTNSYDEALALPTEDAVRIALRTQQIIAHETGVANTIDPLGGAYFLEALTDEIEAKAYEYFAKIDELGGMVEAVKRNYPQREIADAAFRCRPRSTRTTGSSSASTSTPRASKASCRSCGSTPRSSASRSAASRPYARAATAPPSSRRSARSRPTPRATDHNLMPNLLDCARVHATEGEIVTALQQVFGTYTETPVF